MSKRVPSSGDAPPTLASVAPSEAPGAAGMQFKEVFQRLGPAGPLALVAMTLPALGGFVIVGTAHWFAPWLRSHQTTGLMAYIVGFIILGGLSLLPTYAQSLLGGWAFGFGAGLAAALFSFVGASSLSYLIGRWATQERFLQIIEEHPRWRAVHQALLGSGWWKTLGIITLLRLSPSCPFAMSNLFFAATRVSPVAFVLGTLLGIGPRTAAVVFVGAGMDQLDLSRAQDTWLIVAGIVVTVIVLGIIGYLANRAIAQVTGAAPSASTTADSSN